jgi:hypothetical protein
MARMNERSAPVPCSGLTTTYGTGHATSHKATTLLAPSVHAAMADGARVIQIARTSLRRGAHPSAVALLQSAPKPSSSDVQRECPPEHACVRAVDPNLPNGDTRSLS